MNSLILVNLFSFKLDFLLYYMKPKLYLYIEHKLNLPTSKLFSITATFLWTKLLDCISFLSNIFHLDQCPICFNAKCLNFDDIIRSVVFSRHFWILLLRQWYIFQGTYYSDVTDKSLLFVKEMSDSIHLKKSLTTG